MFVEYVRILNMGDIDFESSSYALMGKGALIAGIGLALIYLGYQFFGKTGAIAIFLFEAMIFAIANDLVLF